MLGLRNVFCLVLLLHSRDGATGFAPSLGPPSSPLASRSPSVGFVLGALTERQMQFWEDVEEGLKDIEGFYQKQGMGDIERIWEFCER